jgi:DUF3071 family protein
MTKIIVLAAILVSLVGCAEKPTPVTAKANKDPKIAAIEDRISKTTPEGKQMIEKAQGMKPEVNEQPSGKTLAEMVDEYTKNMGAYNISAIGWEASQKKTGKWKVVFNYQDYQKQLRAAEWEYDPGTNKLYPFEKENAKDFWKESADAQGKKGKK